MNSFGILDFALPFAALMFVFLCWIGITWTTSRRARARVERYDWMMTP